MQEFNFTLDCGVGLGAHADSDTLCHFPVIGLQLRSIGSTLPK